MISNNIQIRSDNTKSSYNGQCKGTTLIERGKVILIGNATNTMHIETII